MKRRLIALLFGAYVVGAAVSLGLENDGMRAFAWPWSICVRYLGSDPDSTAGDGRWPEPQRTERLEACLETITASGSRTREGALPYCECVMQALEHEWTFESFRAQSGDPAQRETFEAITESCRPKVPVEAISGSS